VSTTTAAPISDPQQTLSPVCEPFQIPAPPYSRPGRDVSGGRIIACAGSSRAFRQHSAARDRTGLPAMRSGHYSSSRWGHYSSSTGLQSDSWIGRRYLRRLREGRALLRSCRRSDRHGLLSGLAGRAWRCVISRSDEPCWRSVRRRIWFTFSGCAQRVGDCLAATRRSLEGGCPQSTWLPPVRLPTSKRSLQRLSAALPPR
jgi:hypothetical protein